MCIVNNDEVTKHVLDTYNFINCCNYKTIIILSLIFGYIGGFNAWIYTECSIPFIIFDIIFALGMLSGTLGLITNNYYGIIGLLLKYLIDAVICGSFMIIQQNNDMDRIENKFTDISKPTSIIISTFSFIVQSCFSALLTKIVTDILFINSVYK